MSEGKRYRVVARTSTLLDPEDRDKGWVNFDKGQIVSAWPKHAPVGEWVKSGHWKPVKEAKA